uniref:Uncharacterized protein n=1 Tax=Micrurus paraensis TaxID=1970185 RepID=A0A2D4L8X1_9SAUR
MALQQSNRICSFKILQVCQLKVMFHQGYPTYFYCRNWNNLRYLTILHSAVDITNVKIPDSFYGTFLQGLSLLSGTVVLYSPDSNSLWKAAHPINISHSAQHPFVGNGGILPKLLPLEKVVPEGEEIIQVDHLLRYGTTGIK